MTLALPFLLALLVSAALTALWRTVAFRLGYTVRPGAGRPAPRPKARFGGVAIALTMFIGAAAVGAFSAVPLLLSCSVVLFVVGVVSEQLELRASTKVVAAIAIASAFLFFDYRLHWAQSLTLDSIITVLWIVGVTSAFDLLDNMDGLCAGIALIAGIALLLTVLPVAPGTALFAKATYLAVLLGAIAGFLPFNIHPASVAMGQSGSLVIGLNMAAMTLQLAPGTGSDLLSIVAVPALLLLIPIADALLVTLSRLGRGSDEAGGDPSSHRLVAIGLSERDAVGLLWILAAVSGLIGVLAGHSQQGLAGLMAAMFTIGLALLAVYVARVRVHENVDANTVAGTITPLGIEFKYRRRLAEVLLDLLLVSVAYYGAYRLRFEGAEVFAESFKSFSQSYPIVLGTQMIAFFLTGTYRGMWRYFSLSDGVTAVRGVALGVLASVAAIFSTYGFAHYSQSLFVIYGLLLLLLVVGSRGSFRLISEFVQRQRHTGLRLVIYGAGDAASIAVRHLLNDTRSRYRIVGLIDDDARKRNMRVHGYRVIGGYDHLVGMVMAGELDAVAVTQETAGTAGLAMLCTTHGVTLHRLAVDWREIPAAEAVAAGAEGRVVPFSPAPMARQQQDDRALGAEAAARENRATAGGRIAAAAGPAPPIRVVHIITRLILGGAQENTLSTAIGQHHDPRFDVTLLCGIDEAGEGNMYSEATRAGVRTIVMPSLLREIRPLTDLKAIVDVYRFLRQGRYTIVHTHSTKAGMVGRIAARLAGVPIVVHTLHGLVFHEYQAAWKNRLYIGLKRFCAPLTDKLVSVSSLVSETALSKGIGRRDQYVTIFSGIELDLFLSARERLTLEDAKRRAGIPPDAPVVGKIGRLFALKGHDQFLAAAAKIAREVPNVHFLFVGDGPLREHLRAEAHRLGFGDRLVLAGRVRPEAVPDYIQAMDVVVHTSLREGIARVLPQAGAVGKPVVTFELDGAPEVVRDGVSGYLVRPLDIDGIAARVVELLRDPEKRRVFGEAGRAFAAEHFSVEHMVERINGLYFELLASKNLVVTPPAASRAGQP